MTPIEELLIILYIWSCRPEASYLYTITIVYNAEHNKTCKRVGEEIIWLQN